MDIAKLNNLQAQGGAALRKYNRLLVEADHSAHDSPAQQEFATAQQQLETDPEQFRLQAEIEDSQATISADVIKLAERSRP